MGLLDRLNPLFERCGCKKKTSSEKKLDEKKKPPLEEGGRAQWSSPTEFLLTCIGYSVGLGNVWRFPYLCYKLGGGAFLIPYIVMMLLIGMPLLFMEYAFGQYFGVGGLSVFKKVCPLFQGIGLGYVILNGLVCVYYNVIIAISLYYFFGSFTANLPWSQCGQKWNTPLCGDPLRPNETASLINTTWVNGTWVNITIEPEPIEHQIVWKNMSDGTLQSFNMSHPRVSPSDEYFRLALLDEDGFNVERLGEIRWHLCLCLLLAWILVVLFVSRGIKSTGKVAYFTATFPYVMLTVLVVRGVTLPGAAEGILYFVTPDWSMLLSPEVWFGAASQLFYSTNLAWGGMITMASYNNFSHNCYRDAIMINIVSFLTSLYAGFAVFSIIGYMAQEYGQEVSEVIKSGPGLAFIAYPRALSLMPLAPMWTALFFFMLFLLGVGSQMVLIETVVTGFVDEFPVLGRHCLIRLMTTISVAIVFFVCGISMTTQMVQVETILTGLKDFYPRLNATWWTRLLTAICVCIVGMFMGIACTTQMVDVETVMSGIMDEFPQLRNHRMPVLIAVAGVFFFLGMPQTTQGGMYVLQLMDNYSAGFCVLVIAICECMVINWIYGNAKFAANVKEMLGKKPGMWWRMCWRVISPLLIAAILIFSFVKYSPARYGTYKFPGWADGIGWFMAMASVVPIFAVAIYKFVRADGVTMRDKWISSTTPILTVETKKNPIEEDLDKGQPEDPDQIENLDEKEAQKKALLKEKEAMETSTSVV